MSGIFLQNDRVKRVNNILNIILNALLKGVGLRVPIVLKNDLYLLLKLIVIHVVPRAGFSPTVRRQRNLLGSFIYLFGLGLNFIGNTPILLTLLTVALYKKLTDRNFSQLSATRFLSSAMVPIVKPLGDIA